MEQGARRLDERNGGAEVLGTTVLAGDDVCQAQRDVAERRRLRVGDSGNEVDQPTRKAAGGCGPGEIEARVHGVGDQQTHCCSTGSAPSSAAATSISRASLSRLVRAAIASRRACSADPAPRLRGGLCVPVQQSERPLGQPRRPGRFGCREKALGAAFGIRAEPSGALEGPGGHRVGGPCLRPLGCVGEQGCRSWHRAATSPRTGARRGGPRRPPRAGTPAATALGRSSRSRAPALEPIAARTERASET